MSCRSRITGALLVLALVAAATAAAAPRIHRVIVPPPPPLPTGLAVDEGEWYVTASRRVLAAGEVTMRVANRGMDDHDLTVVDQAGVVHQLYLEPGDQDTLRVPLAPGTYRIVCSLFAGTPESHEDLGMWTTIEAREDPARAVAEP